MDAPDGWAIEEGGKALVQSFAFKDFSEALGCEPVASIPFDPQLFGMAANNGQMIGEVAALSKGYGTKIRYDAETNRGVVERG